LARGHYKILGYGLPSPWRAEYARLLQERYGIEFHAVAGCIVSRSLVSYVDEYDSVVEAAAKAKFGRDIFTETAEDAQRGWLQAPRPEGSRSTVEWLFPYAPAKAGDVACFRKFVSGIAMDKIVEQCGRPEEIGSGVYIFVYRLQDGSAVTIGTPYLSRIDQIQYTDKHGNHLTLAAQSH
jgi:hypothetical protein